MQTILCSYASIALCLSRTSSMHYVAPSTIQPSTSFFTANCPSPESNFFLDVGSCPLCPDTFGGGKTLWIPSSNALDKLINCAGSLVCTMCIKSSQNTSSMVQNGFYSNRIKNLLHSFVPYMLAFLRPSSSDIVFPSNWCSGSVPTCSWAYDSATSRAVSDITWKKQGDNVHPIFRADGITNSVGASGWFGRT